MTAVSSFEIVLLLMAGVVVLEMLARRLHLPRAAALIAGGIGFALIPGTPDIEIDPDLILVLFLPPLLMSSAWFTAWRDFRADLRIILQLAVGAVAFTTLVVGIVAHWVAPGLPWAACLRSAPSSRRRTRWRPRWCWRRCRCSGASSRCWRAKA
jgi:CPA1 family monovalent cation:H+ antiporter